MCGDGGVVTVSRYQKRVNKIHIWLFSLRNEIFRIFHSKKSRLKRLISHFRQCAYLQCHPLHCFSSLSSKEATYHDFLVFGACRLNGKSLICFMACLIRALLSSSPQLFLSLACLLACSQSPQSPKCFFTHINHFPFPFWESYFSLQQQQQQYFLFYSLSSSSNRNC